MGYSVSENCIGIIEHCEGFRADAYPDPGTGDEPWTLGFGSTVVDGEKVTEGMTCTVEQARQWVTDHLNEHVIPTLDKHVTVDLNQNQVDSLADFIYNVGSGNFLSSTLLKHVNAGEFDDAANEFGKWTKGGGHVLPGLVIRRGLERDLFSRNPG